MVKSYDENGKVYCLFSKKDYSKKEAFDAARKNLKVKGDLLHVSCAKFDAKVKGNDMYDVELTSGDFWCVSK